MSIRIATLLLVLLNLAVFVQVTRFDFIHFDDDLYVTDNDFVSDGLSVRGLAYAFSTEPAPMSNPLTLASHMLDVELFGLNPGGHHGTNLLLHILNTALLFFVLIRATGRQGAAFVVAALFAVHPLHVETVAWISDRKDLLSALFWLMTIWAYVEYAQSKHLRWLWLSVPVYALSLLAKPMAVTLPFVLLLLDVWPLERMRERGNVYRSVVEKTPLFVLSALACAGTWYLQNLGGATADLGQFTLGERILNAFAAYGIYLRQVVWPFNLGVYYLAPPTGASLGSALLGIALLVALGAAAVLSLTPKRFMPWIFVGVCWFVGMLVPVIGLVQVGEQLHADRYTYLPVVGLFIAVVYTASELIARDSAARMFRWAPHVIAGLLIGLLAIRTFDQTSLWRTSETILTHTLNVGGESALIRNNLGNFYLDTNEVAKAEEQYRKAEQLDPDGLLPNYNLAYLAHRRGKFAEAVERLEPFATSHSDDLDVRLLLAEALLMSGRPQDAVVHAVAAQQLPGSEPEAGLILGLSYEQLDSWDKAHAILAATAENYPASAQAQVTVANFLARAGRLDQAFTYYDRALSISPWDANIHYNLGVAYELAGAPGHALQAYEDAVALNPFLRDAQVRLKRLQDSFSEADRRPDKGPPTDSAVSN